MTFSDLIIPGEKIDIRLAQQANRERNGCGGLGAHTYKSSVADNLSALELEITMPTEGPKMVLFEVGLRVEMVFYSRRGLYQCQGVVKERYKRGALYLLKVQQRTELEKLQRREFFRIGKLQDMKFYPIDEEVASLSTTAELYEKTLEPEYILACAYADILDISGGGIRFITSADIRDTGYLLTEFRLQNDKVDQTFFLVNQVIAAEVSETDKEKRIVRSKFLFKDLADREAIVRYVYEEERRMRRAEVR